MSGLPFLISIFGCIGLVALALWALTNLDDWSQR